MVIVACAVRLKQRRLLSVQRQAERHVWPIDKEHIGKEVEQRMEGRSSRMETEDHGHERDKKPDWQRLTRICEATRSDQSCSI